MRLAFFLPAVALVLGGCATTVEGGPDSEVTQVHAFLRVDQAAEAAGATRTHASASFLRVHEGGDPGVVARLVGAAPTLPPEGGCARLDGDGVGVPLRAISPVELVQVDGVTLTTDSGRTQLSARAYPDVAHLLSGVVYTSPDAEGSTRNGKVAFHVAGGAEVPNLDVTLDAPPPLAGVRINGVELGGAAMPGPITPLHVTWSGDRAGDVVYADFAIAGASQRFRCTADATSLVGPAIATAAGTRITVSVHRLRVVPFAAGSLGSAEARFDAAITGMIAFDEPG